MISILSCLVFVLSKLKQPLLLIAVFIIGNPKIRYVIPVDTGRIVIVNKVETDKLSRI